MSRAALQLEKAESRRNYLKYDDTLTYGCTSLSKIVLMLNAWMIEWSSLHMQEYFCNHYSKLLQGSDKPWIPGYTNEESNHILWNVNERLHYVRSVNKCKNRTWKLLSLGTHQVVAVETSYLGIQQFSKSTSTVIAPWKLTPRVDWCEFVLQKAQKRCIRQSAAIWIASCPVSFIKNTKKLSTETASIDARTTHQKFLLCHVCLHLKWKKLQISNQGFYLL